MIFIYPCVTSENVNRQIVPAATKCMEQFFLLQLQNAFNDGIIGCVSDWMPGKHRYGPVLTESSKFDDTKPLLSESAFKALDNIKLVVTENKIIYKNDYTNPRVSVNDSINDIIKESLDVEDKLHMYRIKLESMLDSNPDNKDLINKTLTKICEDIKTEHKFRSLLEADIPNDIGSNTNNRPDRNSNYGGGDEDSTEEDSFHKGYGKKRGELAAEKEAEKGSEKDKTSKTFKKGDDIRIDLTPTSMPLDVSVTYRQGPKHEEHEKRTIMIGVKVVPIQIKNFKKVNDALLNDYFSRTSENIWNTIKRNVSKKLVGGMRRVFDAIGISKFLPDPVDSHYEKNGDVVKQMITMQPSDFVNSSAFRSDLRNAPMNYKFTSSVVMFNKDDIEEDTSIFANRSAMNRIFKLGWTSFAVLDPVKEVMLFISSLDGGFLHELPYSYMFNSLQANDIYKNESGLRNGTRPFSIRKGNFATFARSL